MNIPAPNESSHVTNARVLAIAVPMTLANVTTPLLGVVGTAAIGQLGQAHLLGGVAISAVVFDCIFWLFGFLRMGTVALTAQALGAGDAVEQRAVLARALLLAGAIGIAIIALQAPLGFAVYRVMGAPVAVTQAAQVYFSIRIWSAPFTLANYVVLGWLVGQARTGTALALQIAINVVSIAAIGILVVWLEFGVAGAAIATVIAEGAGLAMGLAVVAMLQSGIPAVSRALVLDRGKLLRMLVVNRDIMIRTAALIAAFFFFSAQSARAGETVLAANAVLNNLVLVSAYFLDGFATACEQLCGRAVGARDSRGFGKAVRLSLRWGFAVAAVIAAMIVAFGPQLVGWMTASPEVRTTAAQFLLFAAIAPLAGVGAYTFDGIYIGATWTRQMRNLMLCALALYLATWWTAHSWGNTGLWSAFLVFLLARGGLQAAWYPALVRTTFPAASRTPAA